VLGGASTHLCPLNTGKAWTHAHELRLILTHNPKGLPIVFLYSLWDGRNTWPYSVHRCTQGMFQTSVLLRGFCIELYLRDRTPYLHSYFQRSHKNDYRHSNAEFWTTKAWVRGKFWLLFAKNWHGDIVNIFLLVWTSSPCSQHFCTWPNGITHMTSHIPKALNLSQNTNWVWVRFTSVVILNEKSKQNLFAREKKVAIMKRKVLFLTRKVWHDVC
jgi:hypothetical protein